MIVGYKWANIIMFGFELIPIVTFCCFLIVNDTNFKHELHELKQLPVSVY